MRRGGFASEDDARAALHRFMDGRAIGFAADPNQTRCFSSLKKKRTLANVPAAQPEIQQTGRSQRRTEN